VRPALRFGRLLLAAALVAPALAVAAEESGDANDLRDLRLGMSVADLPSAGYTGLTCADMPKDAPGRALRGWADYKQCPVEPSGLRAVGFRYDEAANSLAPVNSLYEGTKVGGHPVVLTLLIGGDSQVDGLIIETDPSARLFLRKKAFLFGDQVKARYGEEGWDCKKGSPTADEEPVGGVFLNEHCEKTTPTRRLVFDRELFRKAGQDIKDFTSRSRLEILKPS
jgi:hypothetical protein